MAIKSILCVFGGAKHELSALNAAMNLAEAHAARLRVLHISPEPTAYVGLYGEGIIVSGEIVAAIEKENKERLTKAKQYVASFAAKHHVSLDAQDAPAHHASAQFLHLTGTVDATVAREGRLSDLIVLGRSPNLFDTADDFNRIAPALFNTGRPVLLLPNAEGGMPMQWRDKTVALAWNGSLESARALWSAIPLLERAEKLHVLIAHGSGDAVDLAAEGELMDYLKAHGIKAEIVAVDRKHHSAGKTVLSKAKELKADLLIMGAYGHSMFREMILGGFTEHMLKYANIPLLLSR